MKKCCICDREIEREDAPVLVMSISGQPKLLCDDCTQSLDEITLGKDYDSIVAEIDKIGKKMSDLDPDGTTFATMNNIIASAAVRAKLIKEGKYDFSQDEASGEDGFDEIPEELQETEEDRQKDKADEEKMKKFDKIFNIVAATLVIVTLGVIAWRIVESFILK